MVSIRIPDRLDFTTADATWGLSAVSKSSFPCPGSTSFAFPASTRVARSSGVWAEPRCSTIRYIPPVLSSICTAAAPNAEGTFRSNGLILHDKGQIRCLISTPLNPVTRTNARHSPQNTDHLCNSNMNEALLIVDSDELRKKVRQFPSTHVESYAQGVVVVDEIIVFSCSITGTRRTISEVAIPRNVLSCTARIP